MDEIQPINKIFCGRAKIILASVLILCLTVVVVVSLLREKIMTNTDNQIVVSATGEVWAKPDIAIVRLGVITPENIKVEKVVSENNRLMNQIIATVKEQGVEEKDIKTVTYRLNPFYNYTEKGRLLKGYELTQEIEIKIRDLEKVGQIIEASTSKGANQISDVYFTLDQREEYLTQTRNEAIEKAKTKAKEISQAAGIKLGKIINVMESSDSTPMPYYGTNEVYGYGGGGETPEVSSGEIKISSVVNLVYRVK